MRRSGCVLLVAGLLGCNAVLDIQEKQPGNADGGSFVLSIAKPPPRPDGTASTLRVLRGATGSVDLTVERSGGFAGTLAVLVSGLTRGITVDPLILPPSQSTGTLTIHAAGSAELGVSSLSILGAHDNNFSNPLALPVLVQDAPGALDLTFGTAGQVVLPVGPGGIGSGGIRLLPSGSFILCGHAKSAGVDSSVAVSRVTASGALDPTFALGAGFALGNMMGSKADSCAATFVRPNGGIVFTGIATPVAGQPAAMMTARYRPDGFPDQNFGAPVPGGFTATPFDGTGAEGDSIVGPTENDTFVVGGFGQGSPALLRFSKNGVLDTAFGTEVAQELTAKGAIRALAQQADGSFVAAVESSTLLVARFDANGALDKTFGDTGTKAVGVDTRAWKPAAVVVQPDDAILAVGTVTIGSGASDIGLARLTRSGQLDSTFGTAGLGTVHFAGASSASSAVQSDGALIIAGQTPTDAGPAFTVLRMSGDGSLDMTFGTGGRQTLGVGMAQAVTVDDLGRILVAGFSGGATEGNIVVYRLWP